ncbi:MAG: hypothetical protein B6I38_05565 [Anaerolineaceae bacterium 4572_5.1]|nr:MAG: hypothetical protein B6I38_05565 [Anaerolineaceae bacterium 4572_5.1]
MSNFLRNFRIHTLSFWLGFLAGGLLWWLVGHLRPHAKKIQKRLKERIQSTQEKMSASAEQRHRQNTLELAQRQHLAAPLFSLDEILIPPRLLSPPPLVTPGEELPPAPDIVQKCVPYMPDYPAFAAEYKAPTLTLAEALHKGANLAIIGAPGSGKTVALAHLASQITRKESETEGLNHLIPFFVSAANLLPYLPTETPIETLVEAIQANPSVRAIGKLRELVQAVLTQNRVLLLVDNLDEMPPKDIQAVTQYLKRLLEKYPSVRVVVAASDQYFDGILDLGLAPLAIVGWSRRERVAFSQKWGSLWQRYVENPNDSEASPVNPLLLNGWLFNEHGAPTPLEFTLKVWAAYAGDVRGPSTSDAIEAHIRRMTIDIKQNPISALKNIAWQAVNARQVMFTESEAQSWIKSDEYTLLEEEKGKTSSLSKLILPLLENGLLISRGDNKISFGHIVIAGYLAGQTTTQYPEEALQKLFDQPAWSFQRQTIHYAAATCEMEKWIGEYVQTETDTPLARKLLQAGEWLSTLPKEAKGRQIILKTISQIISGDEHSIEVKVRLVSMLSNVDDPQIANLFRYLLKSRQSEARKIAALGSGFIRDTKAVAQLTKLLGGNPEVDQAICLALVNIGTVPALDAIATALLSGDEQLRRSAAEALANDPQEGYPALQEGSEMEDILVRHAVVYGLKRVKEPWAIHLLTKMQLEEGQWIVKNAAQQALEELQQPSSHIPAPLPALEDVPWLIAFAGEEGEGISFGDSAHNMLLKVLEKGSEEQQLAALSLIQRKGIANVFPILYHSLYGEIPEVNSAAFNTLWHLAASGAEIPHPKQYGLG